MWADREGILPCERLRTLRGQNRRQIVKLDPDKGLRDGFVLGLEQRARRVDDPRARRAELDRALHDVDLLGAEARDVVLAQPPARLGVAAQRAGARARRIDEHDIRLACKLVELATSLEVDRAHVAHPRAARALAQLLELCAV